MSRFKLYIKTVFRDGCTSSVISFDTFEAADAAAKELSQTSKNEVSVFENPPSKESIFMELVKSNPVADVASLMLRAEEVYKALNYKTEN